MTQRPSADDRELARAVNELDDDTLRWAVDAARLVRNPVFLGMVFATLLVVAGTAILVISWFGVADAYYVALQIPYLISGGFAALSLIATGAALSSILGNRRDAALADEELSGVLAELTPVVRNAVAARDARA